MALFSTLKDKFDDGVIDSGLWTEDTLNGGVLTESGGVITADVGTGSSFAKWARLTVPTTYDLTDNHVLVEVLSSPGLLAATTSLNIVLDSNNYVTIQQTDTTILYKMVSGGTSTSSAGAYSSSLHRWWKISHASGQITCQTSVDGITWSTRRTFTPGFSVSSLSVNFGIASSATYAKGGLYATFDNFNANTPFREAETTYSVSSLGTINYEAATYSVSTTVTSESSTRYLTNYQALPQKDYEYRVFDAAGNYIGVWTDVENEFNYSQTINQNASELNVTIPRSPDNIKYSYSVLKDQTGDPILDENSKPISVSTSTPNAVGPDTDIDLNYNVEVWAFYGGYDQLLDENSDPILDSDGEAILSQYGSPNGKRVYTGYIADYSLSFGRKAGVQVVIAPHATEMSHYIFMSSSDMTTVEYNSADPATMARDAITNYNAQGGLIEYTDETIPLSGAVSSYDFKLQTTREAMDKVVDLLPSGFYHYVHPGENLQYLLEKSSTANHIFWYEQHISELDLRKSITQLINKVYVVGGEVSPGVDLFKYYEDAPSITANRAGLERIADSRVTLDSTAEILADSKIEDYKNPRYRTSVTITDAVYDIEAIRLGQMVAFRNFGSYVDELLLQIVSFQRRKHSITLDLDMVVAGENKRIQDIKRNLLSQEIKDIPDTPS